MATLPTLTATLDDAFLHTHYKIRKELTDNILLGTPVWAALKTLGCMKKQVGGQFITRSIRYATVAPTAVQRGDSLPQGETETGTMARWTFRSIVTHVQRNTFTDQQNQGEDKIRDYVADRLEVAHDGMKQDYETNLFNSHVTAEGGKEWQGLNDLVPPSATRATGTYGQIARPTNYTSDVPDAGNTWWSPKYKSIAAAALEVELVSAWRNLFNTISANQQSPDLQITDQTSFELYEEFGLDAAVINKTTKTVLDLGFEAQQFKGMTMVWTPNITPNNSLMLTSSQLEVVIDPNYWMAMTNWKDMDGGTSAERIAHIMSFGNVISRQPRRHGRFYTT